MEKAVIEKKKVFLKFCLFIYSFISLFFEKENEIVVREIEDAMKKKRVIYLYIF